MSLRTISVKVNNPNPKIGNVSYDNNINVKVDSSSDYNVKKINYGVDKLIKLQDVVAYNPLDGDTLVFNAITGKYISKKIDSSQINITNIDAGTF